MPRRYPVGTYWYLPATYRYQLGKLGEMGVEGRGDAEGNNILCSTGIFDAIVCLHDNVPTDRTPLKRTHKSI